MNRIQWGNQFLTGFTEITAQVVAYLPRVLAAIGILIAGWLVVKLIRTLPTSPAFSPFWASPRCCPVCCNGRGEDDDTAVKA